VPVRAASEARVERTERSGSRGTIVDARMGEHVRDGELVRRSLAGDRWADEALFRRHAGVIAGTVMRLLRDRAEAEDVVQDTFVTALSKLGTLREPDAVRSWLLMIAVRGVQQRFRRRRVRRMFGLERESPEDGEVTCVALASDATSADLRTELALLDRALARLPAKERIAWMLRYVEGCSLEETAVACGCSLATAKRRIAAAEHVVREHVSIAEPDEEVDRG